MLVTERTPYRIEGSWEWLGGFFEGEGCYAYYGANNKNRRTAEGNRIGRGRPAITITQKTLEPLEKVLSIVGTGSIYHHPTNGMFYYHLGGADKVKTFCENIRPYVSSRRFQQEIAMWEKWITRYDEGEASLTVLGGE